MNLKNSVLDRQFQRQGKYQQLKDCLEDPDNAILLLGFLYLCKTQIGCNEDRSRKDCKERETEDVVDINAQEETEATRPLCEPVENM